MRNVLVLLHFSPMPQFSFETLPTVTVVRAAPWHSLESFGMPFSLFSRCHAQCCCPNRGLQNFELSNQIIRLRPTSISTRYGLDDISLHLASHVKLESFIFPGLIGQLQPDMNLESPSVIFLCHYVSGLLICHICHLGIRNLFRKAPTCFLERTLCASWPGARQLMNLVWPRSSGSFTLCIPARSAIRYRWSYTSIVEHPWLCTSNDLHCGLYVIGHSALRSPSTNTVLAYSRQYVGKRHHV